MIALWLSFGVFSQNPPVPCGDDYGTSADEANIIQQMRFGSIQDAVDAIAQAKNSKGFSLGCPQVAYNYNTPDPTVPNLNDVVTVWQNSIQPQIESFTINCPRIGRYENNAALGAYYANLAGYSTNLSVLADVANMQEAQQYTSSNVAAPIADHLGGYGYIHVGSLNSCYPGGVVGSSVSQVCNNIPSYCVDYDYGSFAGENFLIGDQYEPLDFYDGGMAYDHGWIGVQMMEAAIQQTDTILKSKFKNSTVFAAQWAINEKPVKNHNYTAKLSWLLALMYNWTGEAQYKDELNYKLDKNLIPGILMDTNVDGSVDGTNPPVAFSDLNQVAQLPGRFWDGHNSLPWYTAMNSWALTEAYCAFRDRGDTARANEIKPYVIAMLDNLSWEVNNLGVIDDQLGVRDLTYALLIGIWKIAQYENESHPEWENAAWAMWNSTYFNTYSTHSVCVGLYLCVLSNTTYQPPFEREDFNSIEDVQILNTVKIYPNPTSDEITVAFDNFDSSNAQVSISNTLGQVVYTTETVTNKLKIDVSSWRKGVYIINLNLNNQLTHKISFEKI